MSDILNTEKVEKHFGGITALNDVNLSLTKQKIIGLIGPNGSGKSTLFNMITNVIEADIDSIGKIHFDGDDITGERTHAIAQKGILRTFQTTQIFPKLTIMENMLVASQNHPGESFSRIFKDLFRNLFRKPTWRDDELKFAKTAMQILSFLEISHLAHELAEVLSGGQRKLLALGRSLMASGKLQPPQ